MRAAARPHGALLRLALVVSYAAATLTAREALQRAPAAPLGAARGDTVLVGLVDGSVHALDAATGALGIAEAEAGF